MPYLSNAQRKFIWANRNKGTIAAPKKKHEGPPQTDLPERVRRKEMPFKSKAQQRFMFAAEERGEVPKGTAKRWAKHTPNIDKLPQKKKQQAEKKAFINGFVHTFLVKMGMAGADIARTPAGPVLVKVAGYTPPPDVQAALNEAAKAKAVAEVADLQKTRMLSNIGSPFMAGAVGGAALAKLLRPSSVEVGNLQKKELLVHYDDAINELRRRIVAKQG